LMQLSLQLMAQQAWPLLEPLSDPSQAV